MNYQNINYDIVNTLNKLNHELMSERKKDNLDKEKILKLKEKILMTGLGLSTVPTFNYNRY